MRIGVPNRVAKRVRIRVEAATKSNRIRLYISPGLRIIIPEVVVVQPSLPIKILTRKTLIVRKLTLARRVLVRKIGAERVRVSLPDFHARRISNLARGVDLVTVDATSAGSGPAIRHSGTFPTSAGSGPAIRHSGTFQRSCGVRSGNLTFQRSCGVRSGNPELSHRNRLVF